MAKVKEFLDDYLYYSAEVKTALQTVSYYLQYLRNVCDDEEGSAVIENSGAQINDIFQVFISEDERLEEVAETEKDHKDIEREASLTNIKKAYLEATGEPLLLNSRDIMASISKDMERIREDLSTYSSPSPKWDFLNNDVHKAASVQNLKDKIKAIKKSIQN